jgi:hypothetical protein
MEAASLTPSWASLKYTASHLRVAMGPPQVIIWSRAPPHSWPPVQHPLSSRLLYSYFKINGSHNLVRLFISKHHSVSRCVYLSHLGNFTSASSANPSYLFFECFCLFRSPYWPGCLPSGESITETYEQIIYQTCTEIRSWLDLFQYDDKHEMYLVWW